MTSQPDVRPLTLADVDAAANVIARAFVDDPLCAFMLPSRGSRINTLAKFFRAYGAVSIKAGRGHGAGNPLQGVAYWKSPDQESLSVSVKSLAGFLPLLLTGYPRGYVRARDILAQQEAMHAKYAAGPHYYLDNIGVLPEAQGRGVASQLIRPFLDATDDQRVIAYTDTVTPSNVPLYEHFGFTCVEECAVPGTGITIWGLLRPVPVG